MRTVGAVLFLSIVLLASSCAGLEIDSKGYVVKVVDGDTIDVQAISGFGNGTTYRIRFADIDAPELGTPEGDLAKEALASLLDDRLVYVDVDDLTTYDPYGRVVAVVYLPVNDTFVMNVNEYMVEQGCAKIWNFTNNEFDPTEWKLYEPLLTVNISVDKSIYHSGDKMMLTISLKNYDDIPKDVLVNISLWVSDRVIFSKNLSATIPGKFDKSFERVLRIPSLKKEFKARWVIELRDPENLSLIAWDECGWSYERGLTKSTNANVV